MDNKKVPVPLVALVGNGQAFFFSFYLLLDVSLRIAKDYIFVSMELFGIRIKIRQELNMNSYVVVCGLGGMNIRHTKTYLNVTCVSGVASLLGVQW